MKNKLPVAEIKNKAGNFILPNFNTVTNAAAEAIPETPDDLRESYTNAAGPNAYPIASYVYVLVYREQPDPRIGKT
ncbi:substrate-binding domain-containing protein, partial [Vibrio alginolyticus]|uniref:substrate-binding domain-containing protein n=1 Tax=Vibrio alginolyticus TaxID=663 RepID=UPI001F5C2FCA